MAEVEIFREIIEKSPGSKCVSRTQNYVGRGLERIEIRSVTSEDDYENELYVRYSEDNGRTWTDWKEIYLEVHRFRGDMELVWPRPEIGVYFLPMGWPGLCVYNPVHDHYVALNMQRLFLEPHRESYRKYWEEAVKTFTDHSFIWVSKDLKNWRWQQVKYEEGADFSEDDWVREDYVNFNEAYAGCNIEVLENGDIIFPVAASLVKCCRLLGIDVNDVFPSCPQIMYGLIVFRGHWNKAEEKYDLTPSKPVVISDLKSSRGVDEPTIIVLKNGRIVVVFRGSNVISKSWRTRILRGTPSHKWYTFSDDGGRTFSEPAPWHYDNGEVFYSPASISRFFRSTKNGRAYWFGNITGSEAYGNSPRYPLVMAEVDEETGFLKKETYTVIEDRNPETESEELQLSNFSLLEDRETKNIELYLTKLGAYRGDVWRGDAYKYVIKVG